MKDEITDLVANALGVCRFECTVLSLFYSFQPNTSYLCFFVDWGFRGGRFVSTIRAWHAR